MYTQGDRRRGCTGTLQQRVHWEVATPLQPKPRTYLQGKFPRKQVVHPTEREELEHNVVILSAEHAFGVCVRHLLTHNYSYCATAQEPNSRTCKWEYSLSSILLVRSSSLLICRWRPGCPAV